ncbi:hypothetical protein [Brevibacillus choshinensis]|uniref:hypothetical protein n=1 Tax=Brevibacillus choshinensis TaxID=54911 RepID=UPI002E1C0CFB|nr:hypothetical protein [Brevibacillus choshinensis]
MIMRKTGFISFVFFASILLFQANWHHFSFSTVSEPQQALHILIQKKDAAKMLLLEPPRTAIDSQSSQEFVAILKKANKIHGIVDMRPHDYQVTILKNDRVESILFLWVKKDTQQAKLMEQSDTHTAYTLSSNATERLKQIVTERGMPPSFR